MAKELKFNERIALGKAIDAHHEAYNNMANAVDQMVKAELNDGEILRFDDADQVSTHCPVKELYVDFGYVFCRTTDGNEFILNGYVTHNDMKDIACKVYNRWYAIVEKEK